MPVGRYGTLDIFASLGAQASSQTVARIGEDRVWREVDRYFQTHNRLVREMFPGRLTWTQERLLRYGDTAEFEMQRTDEYGGADAQRHVSGVNIGLPLYEYKIAVQWTRRYFKKKTLLEFEKQIVAVRTADIKRIQTELKRAMFTPTNNLNYIDRLTDYVEIPLRALLNGDGTPVPMNPYDGSTFATTHNHFLFADTFNPTSLEAVISTVQEHGLVGRLQVEINEAEESIIRTFPDFRPMIETNIDLGGGNTAITSTEGNLDLVDTTNRKIGTYGAAEVWVKPWQFPGYVTVHDPGQPAIAMRTEEGDAVGIGDLTLAAEDESYPLRAEMWERVFGMSAWNRHAMAHLYIADGASAYVMPDIPDAI